MIQSIFLVILAYWLTDVFVGLYHLITDKGWNIKHQLKLFINHHYNPNTMTHDWQPLLAGIPIIIIGIYFQSIFLIALAVFLCLAQEPHYYCHHPAPKFIQFLQKIRLIAQPVKHGTHHKPPYNNTYCVFAGWNDWWIDRLAKFIPERKFSS